MPTTGVEGASLGPFVFSLSESLGLSDYLPTYLQFEAFGFPGTRRHGIVTLHPKHKLTFSFECGTAKSLARLT